MRKIVFLNSTFIISFDLNKRVQLLFTQSVSLFSVVFPILAHIFSKTKTNF